MKKLMTLLIALAFIVGLPASIPSATDTYAMIKYCTGTADLSAASLTLTCPSTRSTRLAFVTVHADAATTETITVTLDYKLSTTSDTLLKTTDWSANTDFLWEPEGNIILRENDAITVTVTDGSGANNVYATIALEEITWNR